MDLCFLPATLRRVASTGVTAVVRGAPAVFLVAASALAGCGESTEGGESGAVWVGAVSGSDAVVALVEEEEGALRGYVCGGPTTYATHSRWFEGTREASGSFDASHDGWVLTGAIEGEQASGTLTSPDGDELELVAHRADGELEGLYFALDSGCRTGAVVQAGSDGEPWLQGTWCDDQSHFEQVTPVLPITLTNKGIHVRVDLTKLGQDKLDLYVEPISAR